MSFQAFISYRRETGKDLATLIHTELNKIRGIKTFLDVVDLGASRFDNQLKQKVQEIPNFILLLTKEMLDRCKDENDWVRQEIALAIKSDRNIIPVMVEGYEFPSPEDLPDDIREVINWNAVPYSSVYSGPSMDRLVQFLKIDKIDENALLPKATKEIQEQKDNIIMRNTDQTMTSNEQKLFAKIKESLIDGFILDAARIKLIDFSEALDISEKRLKDLIEVASAASGVTINEQKYLSKLRDVCSDGILTASERETLNNFADALEIPEARFKELEDKYITNNNIKLDNKKKDISIQSTVQTEAASDGDVDWPSSGHKFLKTIKKELDISKLPFKPTSVTDDEEIEEQDTEPEMDWMIDDVHYFAVWLTGRRKEKINVIWGIYSDKKRNPEFRKMSDDLYEGEYKKYLDKDGAFSIDGVYYYFETENYIGQSASERKLISEINSIDFIKHVVDNLLSFATTAWPVIEKNLVKG